MEAGTSMTTNEHNLQGTFLAESARGLFTEVADNSLITIAATCYY